MVSKSLLVGLGTAAAAVVAGELAERAADPCAAIAGQQYVAPSAAMACLKSFPYNSTLAKNVLDVVTKVTPFFTFEDWQKLAPAPFTEASSNLDVEFARIKATKYTTDYDFNRDVYNVINRLDDGHTLWLPSCYWASFQNIVPAPLIALEKNGSQDIYIAPNAEEFISLLGSNYTSYYDEKGFNWKKYAGAKLIKSLFTNYRISGGAWSQRLGDFAGAIFPDKDSLTLSLVAVNSTKIETVKFEYRASYLGAPFTDGPSYWQANCAANNATNGVDQRGAGTAIGRRELIQKKRQPVAKISAAPAKSVGLPQPNLPTQPDVINGTDVIKAYVLPDKKTGVLMVGSFGGDYVGFQNDTLNALSKFKAANVQQLIVDTTGNGGGFVCLGEFLITALAGTKFGYAGFESTMRAQPLARKIVASYITQGIDNMYYSPNRKPAHNFPLNTSKSITVANGVAYEKLGIKVAVFGGNPGAAMNFNGMAGNQVLEWADLDSEIKTAGLKNDPLAPPDLLVNSNYRVNWRYAYSWQNKAEPLAFHVERAHYRIPYTADTYMSPQNLWTYV
ncbi:hypothetical protein RSAG8_08837, partial [Rhizoctonia solani AG-8 WAC10335]